MTRCTMVQLSCKITSACMLLASFMRVTKLRVQSTKVYYYSSLSLQLVTSELVNSTRSKQTAVLG